MKRICVLLAFAAVALCISAATANEGCGPATADCGSASCCAQCGRRAACQPKTCQVVCEVKKEKKYVWCVECEDICPLLPGCRDRCAEACNDGCCDTCGDSCGSDCCGRCEKRCIVPPRPGHVRTVKKLVKKEYEVEVPVYKCVVKNLCGDCCAPGAPAPAAGPAPTPAPAAPLPPMAPKTTQLTPPASLPTL